MKGAYFLVFKLPACELRVGKLGKLKFKPGYYLYVGSGMQNLEQRVLRYFGKHKLRWHVDYVLQRAKVLGALLFGCNRRIECKLAAQLSKHAEPIPHFGSSDCNCYTHLYYFESKERLSHMLNVHTSNHVS